LQVVEAVAVVLDVMRLTQDITLALVVEPLEVMHTQLLL
jgi:hypothetical protein